MWVCVCVCVQIDHREIENGEKRTFEATLAATATATITNWPRQRQSLFRAWFNEMCERIKLHVWSLKCLIGNTLCTHQCCYGIMESLRCARVYIYFVLCDASLSVSYFAFYGRFRPIRYYPSFWWSSITLAAAISNLQCVEIHFVCAVLCCAMLYCIPCALIKLIIKFLLLLLLFIKMIMSIFAFLFHAFFPLVYSFDIFAGSCTIYG